jgi:peptide alpha-N-acetyltransferase
MINIQNANLLCLPENYQNKYFVYHTLNCPPLIFCAENYDKMIVGYVLAKLYDVHLKQR